MAQKAEIYFITKKYDMIQVFTNYKSNTAKVAGFLDVKNRLDGDMARSIQFFAFMNGNKLETTL